MSKIKMTAIPEKAACSDDKVRTFDVLVRIEAPKPRKAKGKKPVNAAIAIDISGSMGESAGAATTVMERIWVNDAPRWPKAPVSPSIPSPVWPQPIGSGGPFLGQQDSVYQADAALSGHWETVPVQKRRTKMDFAIEAAVAAIDTLSDDDCISIVSFDGQVTVELPAGPLAGRREAAKAAARRLAPRGATALHAGWVEAGKQACAFMDPKKVNRVLVLTDGNANNGKTSIDEICVDVSGLKGHGVSTSCFGMGADFNEDLMEAMASAGDGNYWYIEDGSAAPEIFKKEFGGLSNIHATKASLTVIRGAAVRKVEILNDFPVSGDRWTLPNLVGGAVLEVLLRLEVDGTASDGHGVEVRLDFERDGKAQSAECAASWGRVDRKSYKAAPCDEAVDAKRVVLLGARSKREAMAALDRGDFGAATAAIGATRAMFSACASVGSMAAHEISALNSLEALASSGDAKGLRKSLAYQSYQTRSSKAGDEDEGSGSGA